MNPFADGERYYRLSAFLERRFGKPVRTVTLRGSFGCPNRDGRTGQGGCLFCSESALVPRGPDPFGPVCSQLESGIAVAERRTRDCGILAYFQDGTVTAAPRETLLPMLREALAHRRVMALAIGTRPDYLPGDVLDLLGVLSREKPVWLEIGLQVANDELLARMNRHHTVADFANAVRQARERGLDVIAHLILDLPSENEDDRVKTAALLNQLGVAGVKIHNLHVLKGTPLEALWRRGEVSHSSMEEYMALAARFLEYLDPAIVVHRLTGEGPADLMLAPQWALDKSRVIRGIRAELERRDTWQGRARAQ